MPVEIVSPGTLVGAPIIGGTANEILFINSSGKLAQTSSLFFNSTNHLRIGTTEFGTFHDIGTAYPSLSIFTNGGDALNVGNANGWIELGVEAVGTEMGLITMNDEFMAVKDSFPNGGYTYGNGGLKTSYGTGSGDGDTMVGNGTAKPGVRLFSWGTGNGGGATAGQIGWGDKTNGVQLGLLSDLGNGYSGAFYLLGDSLQAPFGEMAEFDILDRQLQPGDARIAFTVGRIDSAGGFRYDIGIRDGAGSLSIPFGVTPTGIIIGNTVDGIEPSAYLHLTAATGNPGQASLKIDAGLLLGTIEVGAIEYDGTNLLFTRTGAARENVFCGNSGASAPTTVAAGAVTNRYGGATNFLGNPNSWASVNLGGNVFKVPLYT